MHDFVFNHLRFVPYNEHNSPMKLVHFTVQMSEHCEIITVVRFTMEIGNFWNGVRLHLGVIVFLSGIEDFGAPKKVCTLNRWFGSFDVKLM